MSQEDSDNLEVGQDLGHEKRAWRVKQASWILMVLAVLAALAGAAGSGPLSHRVLTHPGSLSVEYERWIRFTGPHELVLHFASGAATGASARVWLGRDYLEGMEIENVVPEPEHVEAGADRLVFVFPLVSPGNATTVTFHLKPHHIGPTTATAGLEGKPPLRFRQFVLP
jgi:hypothetical protein